MTVRVLTVTGSSEDTYTVMLFDSHRNLRQAGNCPRSTTLEAAATSTNFLAAAVKTPFPLLMDYSWLLLRCMDAYQWLSHRSPLISCHSTASAQHIAHRSSAQPALNWSSQCLVSHQCQPPPPPNQMRHPARMALLMKASTSRYPSTRPPIYIITNYTNLIREVGYN